MLKALTRSLSLCVFGIVAVTFATPSCGGGGDCEAVCMRGEQCLSSGGIDCSKLCSDLETTSGNADCSQQFDDFVTCEDGLTDICKDSGTTCKAQTNSFGICVTKYCVDHQAEAGCADFVNGL
ncbi:MAG TPA: hypothetical protein VHB21_16480 [Minicystis sp.]|nr:hypothetical protein [Minicystis sp.]